MTRDFQIEEVLRRHGLTRALRGYDYPREMLRAARDEGREIGPDLLTDTARALDLPRYSMYHRIDTALQNMYDLPEFYEQKRSKEIYRIIDWLFKEL